MTARSEILKTLALAQRPIGVHEFYIGGTSQTAISARLRELARELLVVGETKPGKSYKVWSLAKEIQVPNVVYKTILSGYDGV